MIPVIIQKRGAIHLDEAAENTAAGVLLNDSEHGIPINPDRAVLELIPESVARENLVVPLRFDENGTLLIAVANPHDILLRDKLGFIINKPIRFIGCPRVDIAAAIKRHYGHVETESVDSMLCEFTDTAIGFDSVSELSTGRPAFRGKLKGLASNTCELKSRIGDPDSDEFELMLGERDDTGYGRSGMLHYMVEDGQRALMIQRDGRMEVIVGPRRVWRWGRRFERMRHHVAHPGDFLLVRFRDGRQEHFAGPTDVWFDPRIHEQIAKQESLQLAAKEAVIVYSRAADGTVARRIVYGPTLFTPAPGEWLHTFAWHGSEGGSQGVRKVAKGLVFQKLWLMPDQMYHDVPDVRTSDDAVLTIKLMMFFELLDIDRMLEATHDPIGDFINAATSDVVDFTGHRTFEEFKKETGKLNELDAYRQLTARAAQNGYRINKVVYRGYGAPDRLQAMHDQAIESRTKLQLERATEEQAQNLEDFKLNAMMNRAARRRTEQATEVETEIELSRKRHDAERTNRQAESDADDAVRRQANERERQHLAALRELGVELTQFLTQNRADRVIELRGRGVSPHVHLDPQSDRNGK